jgi:hypothetical protein
MTPAPPDKEPDQKPTLLQVIGSVLSAATGIQNRKNRERDFKHGKSSTFIIAGIIFVILFIGSVYSVVQLVLRQSGH